MDKRKLRQERRREQVRDEILEAAARVLLERGLPELTLAAVARELQLTKAALYYYFDSKEALVFELVYLSLERQAGVVADAIGRANSGAEAIEALIRSSSAHLGDRKDELRLAYLVPQIGAAMRFDTNMLARIRPFNDLMYGAVGEKIRIDQREGRVAAHIDGRRLAFLAHTSVLGMLVLEGLVEVADESPLIHTRPAMVDELVSTFRSRLRGGA